MKKSLLIPTMIFPYFLVLTLASYFIFGNMIDGFSTLFHNNIQCIGIGLAVLLLLAIVMNVIFIASKKTVDAAKLVKMAFVVKCIHIPTYVLIFLFGLLLGLMFFMTFPLILLLILLDTLTLWLSNMVSIYALIQALKEKRSGLTAPLIIALVCQFFFFADVISLFVVNILMRGKTEQPSF